MLRAEGTGSGLWAARAGRVGLGFVVDGDGMGFVVECWSEVSIDLVLMYDRGNEPGKVTDYSVVGWVCSQDKQDV